MTQSLDSKERFGSLIEEAVSTIMKDHEPRYVKGEYFGFLANRVIKRFAHSINADQPSFNSSLFNETKRAALSRIADKFSSMIFQGDAMDGSTDLLYVISAIVEGINGGSPDIEESDIGFRMYTFGMLEQIRDELNATHFTNTDTKSRITNFRGLLVTKRVVASILQEQYGSSFWPRKECPKGEVLD